jgi:hypothetical protein
MAAKAAVCHREIVPGLATSRPGARVVGPGVPTLQAIFTASLEDNRMIGEPTEIDEDDDAAVVPQNLL